MATTLSNTNIRTNDAGYSSGSDDGQAAGGRKSLAAYQQNGQQPSQPFAKPPSSDNLGQAAGMKALGLHIPTVYLCVLQAAFSRAQQTMTASSRMPG